VTLALNPDRSQQKTIERWLGTLAPLVRRHISWTIGLGLTGGLLIIIQSALLAWTVNQVVLEGGGLQHVWLALAGLVPVFVLRFVLARAGEKTAFSAGAELRQSHTGGQPWIDRHVAHRAHPQRDDGQKHYPL